MKKSSFLAIVAMVAVFTSCDKKAKEIEQVLDNPAYTSVTVEGSGKYGIIDSKTKAEILPQMFDAIDYLESGYFLTHDSIGLLLYDTAGTALIPAQNSITEKDGYFELISGDLKGFYFPEEKSVVTGNYEQLTLDGAGNICFLQNGKYGVLNKKGETVIPCEYNVILWDGKNYNVAKNKNDKRPYVNAKTGKCNWARAAASVLDKDGKVIKKLPSWQAKKIFEAKK